MSDCLLSARRITKSFGAVQALQQVSIDVMSGDLCGLIGPNGSGKSTFFDCVTGLVAPDEGCVLLDGTDVTAWPIHRRAREGRIFRSFQRNVIFSRLTVEENLILAGQQTKFSNIAQTFYNGTRSRHKITELTSRANDLLQLVNLRTVRSEFAGTLSVGQQKLLQFAAMLMPSPRLILLDEPLAGVNPLLVERISEAIVLANKELGTTIMLIEHNIEVVMTICRRVIVLGTGTKIADDVPEAVSKLATVREAYLGY